MREIDVRCDLPPAQADRLAVDQAAQVVANGDGGTGFGGRVASVGVAADRQTGLVPVLVRVANSRERLRSGVPVRVKFVGE